MATAVMNGSGSLQLSGRYVAASGARVPVLTPTVSNILTRKNSEDDWAKKRKGRRKPEKAE
jgi:hypothetical protein